MRCSSCDPLLDRYVEGTLTAREMADVSAHLRECDECRALLDELKVVDALLFTTRTRELPQNFTFAVMAEANSLPPPRARQHPVWSFLVLYSAAAWVAVVVGLALSGIPPSVVVSTIATWLSRAGAIVGAAAASASQGLTHGVPTLVAFSIGVLTIDVAIASAFALLYFVVRPRVAAQLAASPEVRR